MAWAFSEGQEKGRFEEGGTASLMLNGTSKGEDSNLWVAARYQMSF